MTDLPFLASRLYGTPLLVARPKLEIILSVMKAKFAGEALPISQQVARAPGLNITEQGIAVLPILGTLVRRSSYLGAASGLTAYHDIEAMAEEAFADPQVRGVLLEIDSSGGEAGGIFDLAEHLRNLAKATGKPLWAIADEAALSAAYALACAAEKIWLTRTSQVGSVGVLAVHMNESEADRKEGVDYTFIHAGAHKVDGHSHAPLSPDVQSGIQADVDGLYVQFVDLVANFRGIKPDKVRVTEAQIYRGAEAIKAGLADRLGTFSQTHDALASYLDQKRPTSKTTRVTAASLSPQENSMTGSTQPNPNPQEVPITSSAPQSIDEAAMTAQIEMRLRAQLTELTEVAAQAKRFGVAVDPAQALSQGVTPDALRKSVLKEIAERDVALDIVAQAPSQSAPSTNKNPADSPLVKAAKAFGMQGGR